MGLLCVCGKEHQTNASYKCMKYQQVNGERTISLLEVECVGSKLLLGCHLDSSLPLPVWMIRLVVFKNSCLHRDNGGTR
jgi:hypothetical protein